MPLADNQTGWVYKRSEPGLYTVGFYSPDGEWHPDSDWESTDKAATRVNYLNGGLEYQVAISTLTARIDALQQSVLTLAQLAGAKVRLQGTGS